MWTSIFKKTDNNSLLKNINFRNYLSQTQLNSIKNKLHYNNKKNDDINLLLEGYLDKIHNPLNDNFNNELKNSELKNNKLVIYNPNNYYGINHLKKHLKKHFFIFVLTSLTTTIGYFFYFSLRNKYH
jgi:hypothetical protein